MTGGVLQLFSHGNGFLVVSVSQSLYCPIVKRQKKMSGFWQEGFF